MNNEILEVRRTVETILELVAQEHLPIERDHWGHQTTHTIHMSNFKIQLNKLPIKTLYMMANGHTIVISNILPSADIDRFANAIENLYNRQQKMRGPARIEELIDTMARNHEFAIAKQAQSNQITQSVVKSK